MPCWTSQRWPHNLNQMASGKPGAVQIGFQTGMRESAQSWKELLVDLKARGLSIAPRAATGDGALHLTRVEWRGVPAAAPAPGSIL